MIKVIGGQLYQWEINREIEFDCKVDFFHWEISRANRAFPTIPDTDTKTLIPNEFLRLNSGVVVYAIKDGCVVDFLKLDVKPRKKPLDYIFNQSEMRTLESLVNEFMQKNGGVKPEQIAEAVKKYLEENPIEAGEGTVKSVNGIEPDENGNVEVDLGDDFDAANYLTTEDIHRLLTEYVEAKNVGNAIDGRIIYHMSSSVEDGINLGLADKKYVDSSFRGSEINCEIRIEELTAYLKNTFLPQNYASNDSNVLAGLLTDFIAQFGYEFASFEELIIFVNDHQNKLNEIDDKLGDINSILATLVDAGGESE